jgi:hypothetical protein
MQLAQYMFLLNIYIKSIYMYFINEIVSSSQLLNEKKLKYCNIQFDILLSM